MLDEQVVTSVAVGNLKAISEQPALLSNLAYSNALSSTNISQQNAVANQQAGNQLDVPLVANATNVISNLGPLGSRSAVDVLTNNELAQAIADLKSVVNAFAASGGSSKPLPEFVIIDEQGRVVIYPVNGRIPEIVIPGTFSRERVEVASDSRLGIVIRIRETR
jgi:hypothetical protein